MTATQGCSERNGMTLTDEQLDILRHMLGINDPCKATPEPYRNYYCAGHDDRQLAELATMGAVRLYRTDESYDWYTCTEDGTLAAMRSFRTIRKTKKSRRYARFLNIADAWPDLTFRQFLTDPQFEDARRNP